MHTEGPTISIEKIIVAAAGVTWYQRKALLKVFVLPALFLSIIINIITFLKLGIFSVLFIIVIYFLFIPLIINVHRTVLLGSGSVDGFGIHMWGKREKLFFVWSLGIAMFTTLVIVPIAFILTGLLSGESNSALALIQILIYVPAYYIISRLSIALPAIAVDLHPNLRWVMNLTQKDHWRIFLVVGLFPLIISFGFNFLLSYEHVIFTILKLVISPFLMAFEIILLTLTYHELNRNHPIQNL